MKTKLSVLLVECLMLAMVSPLAYKAAAASSITEGKINGVMYASGGVGQDERTAMEALAKRYNVHLTFVEAPRDYVSDVKVKIMDHQGKLLLETTSNGPWFWIELPKGDYRVMASFRHHGETKSLKVAGGTETVEFFWKA